MTHERDRQVSLTDREDEYNRTGSDPSATRRGRSTPLAAPTDDRLSHEIDQFWAPVTSNNCVGVPISPKAPVAVLRPHQVGCMRMEDMTPPVTHHFCSAERANEQLIGDSVSSLGNNILDSPSVRLC